MHFSSKDYVYLVGDSQVKCLNCPADENEYNDVDNVEDINIQTNTEEKDSVKTTTVKVDGQNVIINESSKPTKTGKTGKLTVGTNGVIIKTN